MSSGRGRNVREGRKRDFSCALGVDQCDGNGSNYGNSFGAREYRNINPGRYPIEPMEYRNSIPGGMDFPRTQIPAVSSGFIPWNPPTPDNHNSGYSFSKSSIAPQYSPSVNHDAQAVASIASSNHSCQIITPRVTVKIENNASNTQEGTSSSYYSTKPNSAAASPLKRVIKVSTMSEEKKTLVSSKVLIGRRRGGGRSLPTGIIHRSKTAEKHENLGTKGKTGDHRSMSRYMAEVEQYKKQTCSDDVQNRPLVK